MSFCNQCGAELQDGAKFCGACGAPAGAATITTAAAAAPLDPAPPPQRPTSFSQPLPGGSATQSSGSGLGWILPVLVIVAAIAIAYLMFAPKRDGAAPAADTPAATADGGAAPKAGAGDAAGAPIRGRAVDEASDAAAVAGANARNAGSSVSAAVLDSAFNSDPDGAALRYAGPIQVSGTIASMVQPGSTPSLSMEGRTRFNYMVVSFPVGYRERLAPLSKGQFITVACDEVRGLGGTTLLSGCLLR